MVWLSPARLPGVVSLVLAGLGAADPGLWPGLSARSVFQWRVPRSSPTIPGPSRSVRATELGPTATQESGYAWADEN
jgi:hypothetical protein